MTGPPPRFWLTKHALEQATAMGITADEVRGAISNALVDVPSDQKDDCRLAHDGRIKVVYNPSTGDVVTVFWLSHDWMPDRYLHPDQQKEQSMSGWINLDAKGAEKLLTEWGFVIHSTKLVSNLWTHPDDPEKRLIPFSIPARGAKANGKGSYRTAAQVCGVPVAVWLKGPTDEARAAMRRRRQLATVDAATHLLDAPDPLGVNHQLARQTAERVQVEMYTDLVHPPATAHPAATSEEPPMPLSPADEKVLAALLETHHPITSYDIGEAIGSTDRKVRESLRKLEKLGDAHRVGSAPARPGARAGGTPAALWWYEAEYTAPDPYPTAEPAPAATALPTPEPAPEPTPAPAPLKETPVPAQPSLAQPSLVDSSFLRDRAEAQVATPVTGFGAQPAARVFEETEIRWPTGGIVIKDDAGNLYVARALTEEGR